MGFSLNDLANKLKKRAGQVYNNVENGVSNIGAAPHPVQINTPQVTSQIQNAKYGVLAQGNNRNVAVAQLNNAQRQAQPSISHGLNNAMDAFNNTNAQAGRFVAQNLVAHPAMEVAQSVRQRVTGKPSSYTPGSPQAKAIFGDAPVQSLQSNHASTQSGLQHNSNPVVRALATPLANANTALHVLNDIPVVGGAAKLAEKGIVKAAPSIEKATTALVPKVAPALIQGTKAVGKGITDTRQAAGNASRLVLNTKPHPFISDAHETASMRVRQAQQGNRNHMDLTPQDIELHNQVMKKLGATDNNPGKVDQFLSQRQNYREVQGSRKQQLRDFSSNHQLGGSMKPVTGDVPTTKLAGELTQPAVSPQLPASIGKDGVSLPNNSKQTRFTGTTVPKSPEVSDPVKAQVDASYVPGKNSETVASVQDQVRQQGLKPALNETLDKLNTERGTAHRDTLAKAIEVAKQHDALGTPEDQAIAAHLYDLVGEHGSAKGQGAQILATIARSSPAGLRNKAFRDLKNSGVNVTPELQAEIQSHIDAISSLPEGPTRDMAIAVLQKTVSKHIPQGKMDNVISVWKAGLLSGAKTQGGNAESNASFALLKKASDAPAALADKGMSLVTGKRSVGFTGKGYGQGFKQGLGTAKGTLKTGIDVRDIGGNKYEQHAEINFGNPVIQKVFGNPANMVFRGMKAADQPFYYAAFKNSLYDQAKADGMNLGLRGKELVDYMHSTVKNPTEHMANIAEHDANRAVLNFDTIGSKAISAVHTGIDNFPGISPIGKQSAHAAINVLAPFVRIPSAFISRTIDFTPLGPIKTVIGQASRGKFDQRALSQAIGEGATGTGVIALGMALTHAKILSGDYPKNDPKEAQRWKAEGITPNSVKLGNKWVSLNYLGPVGLLFNAGRNMVQAKGEGALTKAGAGVAGLGQGLLGQSFLQGFSGFSDAIQNPERNLKSFANSQASSVIPSWSNDIATATDKFQRQADTVGQAVKNRIPGLRQSNPVKQDVYGNDLQRQSSALDVVNPLKPSNNLTKNNPVLSEVNRLHTADPNNSDLQVTPSPVGKSITIPAASKGEKSTDVPLNTKQRYDLQKTTGQLIQSKWGELIKTPEYQGLDDAGKAKALTNLRSDASTLAAREYVTKNNLGTYSKAASKSVQALAGGDLSSYASASDGTGVAITKGISPDSTNTLKEYNKLDAEGRKAKQYKENDYDYKVAAAQYENDKASGKLSRSQEINRRNDVAKAKVGSTFTKDTREMYSSLSKDEVYDLITQDPNGKKMANDLLAYGDALYKATGTQNKFRTKKGAESFQTANRGGGSASAARTADAGARRVAAQSTNNVSGRVSLANKIRSSTIKKPKQNLSSKLSNNSMKKYKGPTLYRKKVA